MLQIPEPDSQGDKSWSGANGLTITAPATTRYEAVSIYNNFFEKRFGKPAK